MMPSNLRCDSCGAEEPIDSQRWRCPCGGAWSVDTAFTLDPATVAPSRHDLWRYGSWLPVQQAEQAVTLGEGMTPLVPARTGERDILAKCEFTNPTGSYKDRGWTVAVTRLKELGIEQVLEDSSGNAGASHCRLRYSGRTGCHGLRSARQPCR